MSSLIYGSNANPSTTSTNYAFIGEVTSGTNWNTTISAKTTSMPVANRLSNLTVTLATAPGGSVSRIFTVFRNGVATSLAITITGSSTTATNNSNIVSFNAGDTITLRGSVSGGTAAASGNVWWNINSSSAAQPISAVSNITSTAAQFISLGGSGASTTESQVTAIMPVAGTFTNLFANVPTAPGSGISRIFTLRVNGANSTLAATITGTATSASNTTSAVTVAAGDRVNISQTISGTPASTVPNVTLAFTPSDNASNIVLGGGVGALPASTTYNFPGSSASNSATETNQQLIFGNYTLKNLATRTSVASGSGTAFTFNARKNATNSSLTTTNTNTTNVLTSTADVSLVQGDKLSISSVPTGSPTTTARLGSGIAMIPTNDVNTVNFDTSAIGSGNGLNSVALGAITTQAANELILIGTHVSNASAISSITASGLTFVKIGSTVSIPMTGGQLELWRAFATTKLNGVVITVNTSGNPQLTAVASAYYNVDTSGTNGSGAIGAISSNTVGLASSVSSNITTSRANSMVVAFAGTTSAQTLTAGNNMVFNSANPTTGSFSVASQERYIALTDSAGTSVTGSVTASGMTGIGIYTIELLAPGVSINTINFFTMF